MHSVQEIEPMIRYRNLTAITAVVALVFALCALPAVAADAGVVNVNTADAAALQLLPRIGPAVATRILEYREANGDFKSKEDLMLVRGIGEATFEQLVPYVALEGPTTLVEKVRIEREQPTGDQG
jgi:competence protein ComEA